MKAIRLIFIFFICFQVSVTMAQEKKGKRYIKKQFNLAESYINENAHEYATPILEELVKLSPNDVEINYQLGLCYLNSVLDKDKSITYLKKAVELYGKSGRDKKLLHESKFYLGKAYRLNYKFIQSRFIHTELKRELDNKSKLYEKIEEEINLSEQGIKLMKDPIEITVTNLGKVINSKYKDHSPVFSADESVLIFTSRREGSTGGLKNYDNRYYEDIYISYKQNGVWSEPQGIGENINTKGHEATIGLSADGQKLYIYRDDNGDGNIYVSELDGNVWSKPKKLGNTINTRYRETHATVSADGNRLYFTSDRKGGYGGLDIYVVRRLPTGQWSEAQNLGPNINTPFDEEGPYIHPDGVTLFFSSKGHNTIGGFDIFTSRLTDDNKWSKAQSIGYPINTVEDDVFFVPIPDGSGAYYASHKAGGQGETDIYFIKYPQKEKRTATKSVIIISGTITMCKGELADVKIQVKEAETMAKIGEYRPNSKSGKFLVVLNDANHYSIEYLVNNQKAYTKDLVIAEGAGNQKITEEIRLLCGDDLAKHQVDTIFGDAVAVKSPFKKRRKQKKLPNTSTTSEKETEKNNIPPKPENEVEASKATTKEAEADSIAGKILREGKYYDREIVIKNILFPFGKANTISKNAELDKLAVYLIDNPGAKIEIGAHADAQGAANYNYQLTIRRAKSVKKYLINKKVNPKQLVAKGYGEKYPIAKNQNADGTWCAEGQKYNRRVEFKVLKQGKTSLYINSKIPVPKKYALK